MRHRYLQCIIMSVLSLLSLKVEAHFHSIEFVENKGQWDGPFLYKARANGSYIYLDKAGFTFILPAKDNASKIFGMKHRQLPAPQTLNFHTYKIVLEGANSNADITGNKPQNHYYNYFLGNDPSRWKSGIHPFFNVDYKNIYNGIDLHVGSDRDNLKYDFIVYPGQSPDQIQLRYDGAQDLRIRNGNLQISTSVGVLEELAPYAYQYIDGVKKEVPCKYTLKGNKVTFYFPEGYDVNTLLTIDPVVAFATFTGSAADNWGFTATYDAKGYLYAGGIADDNGKYPTTTGAFSVTHSGGGTGGGNSNMEADMSITKFDTNGSKMIYSTYIGGADNDQPHSMIVDPNGNLIIAGRTYSSNYPTLGAYDNTYNGNGDIVVTKLNASGTALLGSTYFGGTDEDGVNISSIWATTNTSLKHSYADDARSEVITDNAGNIYLAASTKSASLPITGSLSSTQDGLVLKFNSNLSSLTWGTYIGGSGDDAAYVLALNKAQNYLYVAGGMTASGLINTAGTINTSYQGGLADGFIIRFVNSGSYTPDRATYIGTSAYDQCFGVQVDGEDNVYVMGQTLGNYPIQPASTSPTIFSVPGSPQFVTKMDKDLSTILYSTRFGSPNAAQVNISPVAFLVDTCQNVYISGWGGTVAGNGSSTNGMPTYLGLNGVTPTGIITTTTDGSDFYFIALSKNAIALQFAGYYGGSTLAEHVDGGTSRFDKNGVIYQAICGGCGGSDALPTTTGAFSNDNGSNNCNLAAIKIEFNLGAVVANAKAEPNAVACLGDPIQFSNTSANAVSYEWDFGDGSATSTQRVPPPHTYSSLGTFNVRMIAINPNACVVRDTAFLTITVDTNKIAAGFNAVVPNNCAPYTVNLNNNSRYSKTPNAQNITKFFWDFGDGKTLTSSNPGTHVYTDTGTYKIIMIMTDTTACNSPDTVEQTVHFSSIFVKANFDAPDACQAHDIPFTNGSVNADSFLWTFSNKPNDTSTARAPVHVFKDAGIYHISLRSYNSKSCNLVDSFSKDITVKPAPVADFDFAPKDSATNVPASFTNQTVGATAYLWDFGDHSGSEETNPVHMYKKSGSYTVCLTARNTEGCSDTVCKKIDASVLPLADLPTGFSPNGDDKNDVLMVRGAGVEKFNLKIYNRWGQVVFDMAEGLANDPKYGWDGKHKGKEQPMDSYAFVLHVDFTDGTTYNKKGNVTLLR